MSDDPLHELQAAAQSSTRGRQPLHYARRSSLPDFGDVRGSAGRLRAAGNILGLVGWAFVALGLVAVIGIPILMFMGRVSEGGWIGVAGILYGMLLVAVGILYLGGGAAFKMLAAIGLATVEIAKIKDAER